MIQQASNQNHCHDMLVQSSVNKQLLVDANITNSIPQAISIISYLYLQTHLDTYSINANMTIDKNKHLHAVSCSIITANVYPNSW